MTWLDPRRFGAALAALALLLLTAGFAQARPVTEEERAALATRIATFEAAMRARDMGPVIGILPPRILAFLSQKSGAPVEAIKDAVAKQATDVFQAVTVHQFGMDLSKAESRELPNGTPYLLIPTTMVLEAPPLGKTETRSDTLAIMDEGTWYLLDLNGAPQLAIFTQVYPEFAGVSFGGKTSKTVP
jgi:hypothetical protein